MEKEQALNPTESLALISDILIKTRENIREHSFSYLLWGWVIAIASLSSFLLLNNTGTTLYFLPFPVLSVLAAIVNLIYCLKQKAMKQTETYLVFFLNRMWLILGISFFIIVFISVMQNVTPFAYTILLGGIGTLISGLAMKYRPLIVGGLLFFGFAVVSVYVSVEYKLLLQGIAIVTGNLIPGYMLKYQKHQSY